MGKKYVHLAVAAVLVVVGGWSGATANQDGMPVTTSKPTVIHPAPRVSVGLNSPKETMFTFLAAINRATGGEDGAWAQVYQCLELAEVDRGSAKEVALQLWGVLNRLEHIDDTTPLPDAQAVERRALTRYGYFPDPRFERSILQQVRGSGSITIVLTESGVWKFSSQTVAGIRDLYVRLADLKIVGYLQDERHGSVALWLRDKMPHYLKQDRLLNMEYWQWLGLAVLILLGMTLDHVVRLGLRVLTNRLLVRRHASARSQTIVLAVRPLGLVAAGLFWLLLLRVLNLPSQAMVVLSASVQLLTILAGTWAAWCMTDLVGEILQRKAAKTTTKFDDVLIPLIRKTIKVFIVAFGLIYSAAALSIPVMPMLTSLGIGGLAFAFAAKDTIENFFGSVAVILDRPFEVGDWVVIGDVEGTVEEVGFRSTRIRTFYNSQVTVPNSTLVRATVDNYGRRRYRRVKTYIGIQYDTPPDKIVALTEGIRELVRSHPYTRKDYFQVWFHQFGPSSFDILLYVFHEAPDWSTELRERERLFLDIVRLAEHLGVQFAFPTRTVHLYQADTSTTDRPSDLPSAATESEATQLGVQTARRLVGDQPWLRVKPGPVQFQAEPIGTDTKTSRSINDRTVGS